LRWFDVSPRRATPKGHKTFIIYTAPLQVEFSYINLTIRARGALKRQAKYVVSNTLTTASWNNTTIVSGDVAGQLKEIKERTGGDIGMSGSATLVRWLLAAGLLDELGLLVHPIVVGHGQRLFEDSPTHPLRLVSNETLSTGVLHLTYTPADR
jgi:dihydrofolate reductase